MHVVVTIIESLYYVLFYRELNNSPKRRQYRTVHQETQSEIIKRK